MKIQTLKDIARVISNMIPEAELSFAEDAMLDFKIPRIYTPDHHLLITEDCDTGTLDIEIYFLGSDKPSFTKRNIKVDQLADFCRSGGLA